VFVCLLSQTLCFKGLTDQAPLRLEGPHIGHVHVSRRDFSAHSELDELHVPVITSSK
jgi:hypothetical protein